MSAPGRFGFRLEGSRCLDDIGRVLHVIAISANRFQLHAVGRMKAAQYCTDHVATPKSTILNSPRMVLSLQSPRSRSSVGQFAARLQQDFRCWQSHGRCSPASGRLDDYTPTIQVFAHNLRTKKCGSGVRESGPGHPIHAAQYVLTGLVITSITSRPGRPSSSSPRDARLRMRIATWRIDDVKYRSGTFR